MEDALNYPLWHIFFIHLPNFRNDQQITAIFYRPPITSAVILSYFPLNCSDAPGIELCIVSNGSYPAQDPRQILCKSSFLLRELSRRYYFRVVPRLEPFASNLNKFLILFFGDSWYFSQPLFIQFLSNRVLFELAKGSVKEFSVAFYSYHFVFIRS